MIIHYITPFSSDKNIGKEYNDRIAELPEDCYICLRDGDSMFLTPDWGKQIEEIILANPQFQLIGCVTNRLRGGAQVIEGMFDEGDISKHIQTALSLQSKRTEVLGAMGIAGLCMIFHKSVWNKVKFQERSIKFDSQFCGGVAGLGMRIGIATGLYLFHLYRWGKEDARNYTKHLQVYY